MKRLAPLALIASLALAGCSAGNQSADATPTATSTPSATASESPTLAPALASESSSATKTVDPSQAWADDMMNLLLNGNSKSTLQDFSSETALPSIETWSQQPKGTLNITVSGKNWSKCDIDSIGFAFMDTAGWKNPGLKRVIVTAVDTDYSNSLTHDEYDNYGAAIPESCF